MLQSDGYSMTKAQGLMLGVTADQAFNHFYEPSVRASWDNFLCYFQTVEKFPSVHADVVLSVFATPPGVKNREFLEYRQVRAVQL